MTDAQIFAIAITVLAVLAGSVFNNVRIGDVNAGLSARISEGNASMNRRIDDLKEVLRAELRADMATVHLDMTGLRADMTRMENKMDTKFDTLIAMVGQLDTRVTKLEERSH